MAEQIIQGRNLMLFNNSGTSYAYATKHTLKISLDTTEVSCREQGKVKGLIMNGYSWTIQSDNLYTERGYQDMFYSMINGKEITLRFGLKLDTSDKNVADGDIPYWTLDYSRYYEGKAIITSLQVNSQNGDNVTYSITFNGISELNYVRGKNDVSNMLPHNGQYILGTDYLIKGWTQTDNTTVIGENNIMSFGNSVIYRNNSSDASSYYDFTVPYDGNYSFTVNSFSAHEVNITAERNYGVFKIYRYANKSDIDGYGEDTNSIMKGKSLTKLTNNDIETQVDNTTYYLPNWKYQDSINAFFNTYKYKRTISINNLKKGEKLRITIGQIKGGTKTHVVYSTITIIQNK